MENETKEIKYADLFGGVGGFRLGIQRAWSSLQQNRGSRKNIFQGRNSSPSKIKCAFYCDNDKYAVQIYNKNFKENWKATDIRTIKTKDIPDIDMLCGGFPCQTFSIAGKRRGFQDTRGTLFFEIARIVKSKRPKIIFLENVKGLLNHNKGQTFRIILQTLSELGYNIQWMVFNSKFFGVPQNRERVFIIGSVRGQPRPEILPFRCDEQKVVGKRTVVRTFTAGGHSGGLHSNSTGLIQLNQPNHSNNRIYSEEGLSPSLNTAQGGNRQPKIISQEPYEVCKTIRTGGRGGFTKKHMWDIVRDGYKIRRLTPMECERLQSFPDGWTEEVSNTQRYKQMGNAVTVNVVQAIAEKLLK